MRIMMECYHDTALVRSLGVPVRSLGHEHGKGNVLLALAKWNGDAVGMVDADPGKQNSVPGEMAKYRPMQAAHGLTLMSHSADARKSLVVIGPTLEDWLVARAGSALPRPCFVSQILRKGVESALDFFTHPGLPGRARLRG